jgi:hypothetical protein
MAPIGGEEEESGDELADGWAELSLAKEKREVEGAAVDVCDDADVDDCELETDTALRVVGCCDCDDAELEVDVSPIVTVAVVAGGEDTATHAL